MKIFRTDVTRTQSSKHHDTGGDVNRKHVLRSDPVIIIDPARAGCSMNRIARFRAITGLISVPVGSGFLIDINFEAAGQLYFED